MSNNLMATGSKLNIDPESLVVVTTYLDCGMDVTKTCKELQLPEQVVLSVITSPGCTSYLQSKMNTVLHAQQNKITQTLEAIVAAKLEEATETGVYSSKDIVDIIKIMGELIVKFEGIKGKEGVTIAQQNNIIGGTDALDSFMQMAGNSKKRKTPADIIIEQGGSDDKE